jgi:hypothetical protein
MIVAEAQVCFLAVSKHEHKFMPGPVKRAHAAIALDPNTQETPAARPAASISPMWRQSMQA